MSSKADNVDDYVSAQMRQLHIPGLSLAIVRDGRVTKTQGYGFANLELRAHATKETVYEIGSNTKQFIMMLVEDRKIHLEDSIANTFQKRRKRGATSQFGICSATPPAFKTMWPCRIGSTFSKRISLSRRLRLAMSC